MLRVVVILLLLALSALLIKYRANKKIQKKIGFSIVITIAVYVVCVMISELIR